MKIHQTTSRLAVLIVAVILLPIAGTCCSGYRVWRNAVRDTREQVLKDDLARFRDAIKIYAKTKGELPQRFSDLSVVGVVTTVPDPMTDRADWRVTIGEDPELLKGKHGIINVHSASNEVSSDGRRYSSW